MDVALFINGIFEEVLSDIISAQKAHEDGIFYLQPYKGSIIKLLKDNSPMPDNPIRLYASTTTNLKNLSYIAEIIGWEDKREMLDERIEEVSHHLKKYQPGEAGYFDEFKKDENKAFNLITIINLRRLQIPLPTSILRKVSDGKPYGRPLAGGWSVVYDIGDLAEFPLETEEQFASDLKNKIKEVEYLSDEDINKRLKNGKKLPEKVQISSLRYRRNPYVIVAVLRRADGICEKCRKIAPFSRKSDGSPFLEVHHLLSLSEGGEDTNENAIALCPNCHREFHHGL